MCLPLRSPWTPSPSAILSLRSGDRLIEERICVIGIARAHRVACEVSIKLPKDIWKKGAWTRHRELKMEGQDMFPGLGPPE